MMNLHIKTEKKRTGSFYTPNLLADLIASDTLSAWASKSASVEIGAIDDIARLTKPKKASLLSRLKDIFLVDPAVGDGAFLLAAASWLDDARCELDDSTPEIQRRIEIVENSLYGVDVVPEAVRECQQSLESWVLDAGYTEATLKMNVRHGNSLIGDTRWKGNPLGNVDSKHRFNWALEFPRVFKEKGGFDVVLGNPPYGNILNQRERNHIIDDYHVNVGGGRTGTWNAAAHFIVRASMVLREGGSLGFLVPNSILRVTQFQKTREFLLDHLQLRKIVDEGSPFEDVTLEMVSIFCEADTHHKIEFIDVESRRPGLHQTNVVSRQVLESGRIFPIYHDEIHAELLACSHRELLSATRGRDIPKNHVSRKREAEFNVPYLTSGRSVKRYFIDYDYVTFSDDWFRCDSGLMHSYENELLVSTKNYRFPRCVLKPKGVLHGGGIVRIDGPPDLDARALGLILNSTLVRYVCRRYLTNYSELTTCLNTGIMNDLPMRIPEEQQVFRVFFDVLSELHSHSSTADTAVTRYFERMSDALVYELFLAGNELQKTIADLFWSMEGRDLGTQELYEILHTNHHARIICDILEADHVATIEKHALEKTLPLLLRY